MLSVYKDIWEIRNTAGQMLCFKPQNLPGHVMGIVMFYSKTVKRKSALLVFDSKCPYVGESVLQNSAEERSDDIGT